LLQKVVKESRHVVFSGDNYSEAWHAEAERRGLPNRRTTVDSLADFVTPKSIELFGKYRVFNERELRSRYEIFLESYWKTIAIEAQSMLQLAARSILPAALRYQAEVADSVAKLKAAGVSPPKLQLRLLDELVAAIEELQANHDVLAEIMAAWDDDDDMAHARHSRDVVVPAMNDLRAVGDKLETLVASDLWPLPTYQEMLFIK